jgi:hypothetical protein
MERWEDTDSWSTNTDEYIDTTGPPEDPGVFIIDEHDAISLKLLFGMAVIVLFVVMVLLCKCMYWWRNRSTYRAQIEQAIRRAETYKQNGPKKKE